MKLNNLPKDSKKRFWQKAQTSVWIPVRSLSYIVPRCFGDLHEGTKKCAAGFVISNVMMQHNWHFILFCFVFSPLTYFKPQLRLTFTLKSFQCDCERNTGWQPKHNECAPPLKSPQNVWLKPLLTVVCLRTEGPRRPVCVSLFGLNKRTIQSLRGPRRVKTTKPQEPLNSNFLRSASPSCDPAPFFFLQEQSASAPATATFASPMDPCRHPNTTKCAGSPAGVANCWAQPACPTHGSNVRICFAFA